MAKKKKKIKKEDLLHNLKIAVAVIGLVALVLLTWWGYNFGHAVFSDEPLTVNKGTHITYELTVFHGESVLKIGRELKKAGVIDDALVFWAQSKVYQCRIEPGSYTVSSKNSSKDIAKYLNQEYVKAHKDD